MHGAGAAATARPVDIEEHRAIAFSKHRSVDAANRATSRLERPGGHVAGDDRIRDTGEPPVPEVNVRATHLGPGRAQQHLRSWFQIGTGEFAYFDRPPRLGHHGRKDAIGHVISYPLSEALLRCGSELTTRKRSPHALSHPRASVVDASLRVYRRGAPHAEPFNGATLPGSAAAPAVRQRQPRLAVPHQPLHFGEHPVGNLLGTEVDLSADAGVRLRDA